MSDRRPSLIDIQNTNGVFNFLSLRLFSRKLISDKKFFLPFIFSVVVFSFYFLFFNSKGDELIYVTRPIELGSLKTSVVANGSLQPKNQVDVGSEISGLIQFVAVDDNDLVSKGDILATLAKDQLNARVMQSRAQLTAAIAKVEEASASKLEADSNLRRAKILYGRGNVSEQSLGSSEANYARAKAALTSANANVLVAEATLAAEETNLSKADIRAPISGLVLTRQVEPGQAVAASLQTPVLFTLAENLAVMELIIDVDEADIGQVKEGQLASFTVDAYPNENFSARLISVRFAPKTVENVVTYQTVLAVDNANYLLRPGMTATATIVIERRSNVMMVPYAALRFMPELYRGEDQVKTTPRRSPPGLMGMMMPRMKKQSQSQGNVLRSGASRIIWVLKNEELESKEVVLGLLDGQKAEIISTNIRVGDQVVINSRLPR